jgi:nitronate monooxygenase
VQIGTAYLLCPEAKIIRVDRKGVKNSTDNQPTLTNIFTGRPARGIVNRAVRELGPISDTVSEFSARCRSIRTASRKL